MVIPHDGLLAGDLSALAQRPVGEVLRAARDLDSSVLDDQHARLSAPLVELVVDSLNAPLDMEPQVVDLSTLHDGMSASSSASPESRIRRRPVVTVMGHVDVGKTTLLDALRSSNRAESEAGGITQSIGAFDVALSPSDNVDKGSGTGSITFIDTPGHEAFASMRAHGADATDIVVLVVAADDGVMPQTIEAAQHARMAGKTVVVAINKCDRPGADPDRVRGQLLEAADINTEQIGGDVQCVEISAKTGLNLDALVEAVLLQAEVLDLQASPQLPGRGICIESTVDRRFGSLASLIVRDGTLRVGDFVTYSSLSPAASSLFGRVRSMHDSAGRSVQQALPGYAVAVTGLKSSITPGAAFLVVPHEKTAKAISESVKIRNQKAALTVSLARQIEAAATKAAADHAQADTHGRPTGDTNQSRTPASEEEIATAEAALADSAATASNDPEPIPRLKVVIKADMQGAADAVAKCVQRQSSEECVTQIVHVGVGDVSETDVRLAAATRSVKGTLDEPIVIGFNVRISPKAKTEIRRAKALSLTHKLIYKLEEELADIVAKRVQSQRDVESTVGSAGVRRVFENGSVAGCNVQSGVLSAGTKCRVMRVLPDTTTLAREVVHEGTIASLKRFSEDVPKVPQGQECGVGLKDWAGFQQGDVIVAYEVSRGDGSKKR